MTARRVHDRWPAKQPMVSLAAFAVFALVLAAPCLAFFPTSSSTLTVANRLSSSERHHGCERRRFERRAASNTAFRTNTPTAHQPHTVSARRDGVDNNNPPPQVLCVGETLWDALPAGLFPGGAPTNVAVHLSSLGVSAGVASCVGPDRLGDESIRRLAERGVDVRYVQRTTDDRAWQTGVVVASIDPQTGDATYEFDTPAAWDALQLTDALRDALDGRGTRVVVMGTLARRLGLKKGATSSKTIGTIRDLASEVVLDVNLRPPWCLAGAVLDLARGGPTGRSLALLKLNDEELGVLEGWCGLNPPEGVAMEEKKEDNLLSGDALRKRMEALAGALNARRVCVTRGERGAALWCGKMRGETGVFTEHDGFSTDESEREAGSDTVGAGDSFLAALVKYLLLEGENASVALERACALGGYVAGCRGATPDHGDAPKRLRDVFSSLP